MSFDLEKFQAVAELGEVIRLQNEAMDRLQAFRKARPYMIMPNLAKMVEENMKENVQVLYKELNNLHKPAEQQTRYICDDCKMAFLVKLPGGICDECRAKQAAKPREYVVNAPPVDLNAPDDLADVAETPAREKQPEVADSNAPEKTAEIDPADIRAENSDISVIAGSEDVPVDDESARGIAEDAEHAATGDKLPIEQESDITGAKPADASGADSEAITEANAAAQGDAEAADDLSDEFQKFMNSAGTNPAGENSQPDDDNRS